MSLSFFHTSRLHRQALLLSASMFASTAALGTTEVATVPPLEKSLEEIVVSGAFEGRKLGETILGATVLTKDELARQLDGSIGETLRRQLGISSTFFGPGASRPIIRGLGGDRIRVLDFGLGSIDASSSSPDHAVAVEPALAERIEILRGTAMLKYGSSAAGGVINIFDGRIPTSAPEGGFDGVLRYGHSSVDDGDEFVAALNASIGKLGETQVIIHGDYSWRDTEDFKIPGFAESALLRQLEEAEAEEGEEGEEEAFGIVENSATKTTSASAGLSFLFNNGFLGFNIKRVDSRYGVPTGHHEEGEGEELAEEEETVSIDLGQTRYDLHGEIDTNFAWFSKAKFRFGYADYEHTELEGDEIGTVFANEGYETRLDLIEKGGDNWSGATGFQFRRRDFSAIGEEAFVPPTITEQFGIYSVKEFTRDRFQFEVGGRFEHTYHDSETDNISRSFDTVSFSTGAGYDLGEDAFIGLTAFRTERAPNTEELFSDGPHLATDAFEIGDVNLGIETAFGLEATYTYATGPFSFVVNGFYTSYDDFIFEAETGEQQDGLDVFAFTSANAKFYGFETQVEVHLGASELGGLGTVDWHIDGQLDLVRAKLRDVEEEDYLPRIPPLSALIGIEASTKFVDLRAELEFAAAQNRVTENELPTEGYTLWNAYLSIRPFEDKSLSIELRGTNLTNADARQHTSFLKDLLPLPGRNVKVSLRAEF